MTKADETTTRAYVQARLDALRRNDVGAVMENFAEDLRPMVPAIRARYGDPGLCRP